MSLAAGTRIGAFEVTGTLGVGGMGEVYRARDLRLGREVALKVLPEAVAEDGERVARFKREAQVLASLNHPHIGAIHGVEEWTSESGLARQGLVLELVEGPTLANRIAGGALSLDETLAIAAQIADALDAAHELGIVHRDLKPANIKVTPDGVVKVLDFGLAKLGGGASTASGRASVSQAPTITTPAMTMAGMLLGTAAYMAPEQAKGREADRRSDVWAFGAVLYEMLTGRRAFQGEDVSDTLAAVLRGEPDWSALPATTPPGVRSVLRRCLERDRAKRLQTAGDAMILVAETPMSVAAPVGESPASRRSVWLALALACAVGALALGWTVVRRPSVDRRPSRLSVEIPGDVTLNPYASTLSGIAMSPDGRYVAFNGVRDGRLGLWLRDLTAAQVRRLDGTENARFPFWSPDGRSVGFEAAGSLKVLDLESGSIRTVCQVLGQFRGASWGDGAIVFASTGAEGLLRVSPGGGTPVVVTAPVEGAKSAGTLRYPAFLPDGRRFVFRVFSGNEVRLGSLDSLDSRKVAEADSQAYVTGDGLLVAVRQGALQAQPFSAEGEVVQTAAAVLSDGVALDAVGYASFAVSQTTDLVFLSARESEVSRLTWVDRRGRVLSVMGPDGQYRNPSLSPDDAMVAVELANGTSRDIWLIDAKTGARTQFTFEAGNEIHPRFSPDGRELAYAADRGGTASAIFAKRLDGSVAERMLLRDDQANPAPYQFSADGRILLHRSMNQGAFNTGVLTLVDGKTRPLQPTTYSHNAHSMSPDGKWAVLHSNELGQYEIFVQGIDNTTLKWKASPTGGYTPAWRRDGRELFYYGADGQLMSVPVRLGLIPELSTPTPLFRMDLVNGPAAGAGFLRQYDVSADGSRFLLNVPVAGLYRPSMNVVLNWPALLPASR